MWCRVLFVHAVALNRLQVMDSLIDLMLQNILFQANLRLSGPPAPESPKVHFVSNLPLFSSDGYDVDNARIYNCTTRHVCLCTCVPGKDRNVLLTW